MPVKLGITLSLCLFGLLGTAQESMKQINRYLSAEAADLGLSTDDISSLHLYNEHSSKVANATFCYVQQMHDGLPVFNAVANFVIQNNEVRMTGNRLISNLNAKVQNTGTRLSATEAISAAARQLNLPVPSSIVAVENEESRYLAPSLSPEEIIAEQLYFPTKTGEIILVWDVNLQEIGGDHWWSVRLNAETGEIVDKIDWIVNCTFESDATHSHSTSCSTPHVQSMPMPPPTTDQYNVFAIPLESPNHGARSTVVGPFNALASPYGWHDDNGVAGEEYTITRGNNVFAYDDQADANAPGYSPDGGPSLNFDFPLDLNQFPSGFLDPAITNLFYMNNIMHDVWYHYGFDEASGNFQQNNYGNGGIASDMVNAEAQDGGGTNNANFATPPDGNNPRMQMYLWDPPGPTDVFTLNTPPSLAGTYTVIEAAFGPGIPANAITSNIVIYEDATPDIYDACETAVNGSAMNGNIVILRRSTCAFVDQVLRAQNEGATAVIVVDNAPQAPSVMTGNGPITIPAVMINQYNGENIIAAIEAGDTVNCVIGNNGPFDFDGDFDNGIIAHEYGHGISTRLTGGGGNSQCLWNEDQMGEGWSDWFGLMLTIEPGDLATDGRGIGTYASGEPVTGNGIRPAPYSTNWAINNYTYAATNNVNGISQPHGIGFIWCTMLWDLNWALIEEYGYDPNVHDGTGGNNMAMHLVINALKLQPCSPGFVDARDAVLAADQLLHNGDHECLIWKVFAKRGLGFSATQGDTDDRTDQGQAFDVPAWMNNTIDVVACDTYTWPENGQTYTLSGTYTSPITSAGVGCDTVTTLNLTIGVSANINTNVTMVNEILLQSNNPGASYQWLDCNDNFAPISGQTNSTFVATENGSYAIEITDDGCVDTSACAVVDAVGIIENDFGDGLVVYPNPTDGQLHFEVGSVQVELHVRVLNISGQELYSKTAYNTAVFELTLEGAAGTYLVEIENDRGERARVRIQKN